MVTPKFRGVTPQFLKYMYLGKRLWGRGSMDDKSGLIGIMSSIESLLENGFVPTRTVVMAFGFDEEASGIYVSTSVYSGLLNTEILSTCQGASSLAEFLLSTYGKDAFALLIDEGGVLLIFILV
jgi:Gly-Xaa carboxypeptidase